MKNVISIRHAALWAAVFSTLGSSAAFAHGPNVELSDVNGQIVTDQLDVTPQTGTDAYPLGTPARVFPSQYNVTNYNAFTGTAYQANQPASMQAIPMTWVSVGSGNAPDSAMDSGYYGQLEPTDAVGNSTIATGPGYAYGLGGFSANTIFQFTFGNTLQYWNNSSGIFGATPDGEQLQAIRGSSFTPGTQFANTLTSNGAQGGNGLQINVGTNNTSPTVHNQLMYRLLDSGGNSVEGTDTTETKPTESDIADGLYLATFVAETAYNTPAGTALTPSLPYYFLFELDRDKDVSSAEVTAAVNNLDTVVGVPEPTSIGLIAVGAVALLGRRRHRLA